MQLWAAGKLTFRLRVRVIGVFVGISAAGAAGGPTTLIIFIECGGLGRLVPFFVVVLWVQSPL